MQPESETKEDRLARLEKELANLKRLLPEHCYGTQGYISVHRATPSQWQKIEDTEEAIKKLKAELGKA
ncbi:MAG: hypothetical protein HZA91_12125 [Verrucomicrobia bacterium]|nr:hypothetical protein [Verrucomicrobiota bacterium]